MTADRFHLAWFLNQGFGVGDWQGVWRGSHARHWSTGEAYIEFARSLERAGFDYLIIEDSNFVAGIEMFVDGCVSAV